MSQLMQAFDATKFDPTQGIPQMPVGKHPVAIIESEVKATKDNSGGMLVLTLQILDGPSKGTTGAYRLNLYNANAQAVEIAHRQLSAICHAIGVYQVTDSQQLHGRPFIVEVGLQSDSEAAKKGYTEVKRVYDANGNEPGKTGSGGPPAQTAQGPAAAAGGQHWGSGQQAPAQQPPPAGGNQWGGSQAPANGNGAPAANGGNQWGGPPSGGAPNPGAPAGGPSWAQRQPG